MAAGLALSLTVPILSQRIIDDGLLRRNIHSINHLGMLFLSISLAAYIVDALRQYVFLICEQRLMVDLRTELSHHIVQLPLGIVTRHTPGYLMSRVDGDVNTLAALMTEKIMQAVFDVLTVICTCLILIRLDWRLALIIGVLLPAYVASLKVFSRRTLSLTREVREIAAKLSEKLQDILAHVTTIKLFNTENDEVGRYHDLQHQGVDANLRISRVSLLSSLIIGSILTVAPLSVIWYGGLQVIRGRMSIGLLFAFNMYLAYLFGPLRNLYDSTLSFQASLASLERVQEIRSLPVQTAYGIPVRNHSGGYRGQIRFERVSFSYDPEHQLLTALDLLAEAGRTTAIVGKSGEGKTTLFNLLLKLHEGYSGSIFLDDQDLRTIDLKSLRRTIRLVPQDAVLFNRSVRDNICYGSSDVSDSDVHAAAEVARADDFIRELPEGYETVVGDRGVSLSGGQRQRIALARALLANPRVLLLDEATSFLDSDTEAEVQEGIGQASYGRTCIVIAHRLNTVLKADKICLLANGKIVASGTHGEMYSECRQYASLVDKQFLVAPIVAAN